VVTERTRQLEPADAAEVAALHAANRAFMAPWDALRDDAFYTEKGQREDLERLLAGQRVGTTVPHGILDDDGTLIGRITLNGIVRGPFLSCAMGYWVAEGANGRGLASAAVARMLVLAFDELGLHRVQAETLLHNVRSQRVLAKNGFVRYGEAPGYLRIAGRWQDHAMFQRLNPAV
jgi:ribosomal-protein-alanine N-acetyltransferase